MKCYAQLKRMFTIIISIAIVISLFACSLQKSDTNESQGCESDSEQYTQEKKSKQESNKHKNNSVLFSTDYDVEDYYDGCFIVSKSDGLLYGLLDMDGKEILPIKYDNIEFMNKDKVQEGANDTLYIKTKYEDETCVVNQKGEVILSADGSLDCIYYIFDDHAEDSPFFVKYNSCAGGSYIASKEK